MNKLVLIVRWFYQQVGLNWTEIWDTVVLIDRFLYKVVLIVKLNFECVWFKDLKTIAFMTT